MPKWMGPFVVQRMVGPVAVKHRLPETMRCHNVLLVKLYRVPEGEEPDISTPLIDVDGEGKPIYKVERIVNHRPIEIRKTKKDRPWIRVQGKMVRFTDNRK